MRMVLAVSTSIPDSMIVLETRTWNLWLKKSIIRSSRSRSGIWPWPTRMLTPGKTFFSHSAMRWMVRTRLCTK